MSPNRRAALVGALLLAPLLQGCGSITGGCTYQIRSVAARGTPRGAAPANPIAADVLFFQTTDPATPTTLEVALGSSALPDGMVTLTLGDARRPGEVVLRATVPSAELVGNRRHLAPVTDARQADRIFDALADGAAVLAVEAGATTLATLALTPTRIDAWYRPRCD